MEEKTEIKKSVEKKSKKKNNDSKVSIMALGGLNEIGKNTYVVEYEDEIIVIDAGVKFADDKLLGIDYIIPDYSYLVKNIKKIKGLFITHGHEDHIGAISFFIKQVNVPIYAPPLAVAMIKNKLEEKKLLKKSKIIEVNEESDIQFKNVSVEFFQTTHSIPDTLGIAVHTPEGTIVETGDFKFDLTPVTNQRPNLQKMAKIGSEGVLAMMSDSTNAERPEFTKSEAWVKKSVENIFSNIKSGRIIFATFASNMSRVKMAAETAIKHGRKVAIFGRSMESAVKNGVELGYLDIPKEDMLEPNDLKNNPADKTLILSTGSQGEPMAALARIANGTHKQISIQPGDTVIFSSSPIPGNGPSVNKVINALEEKGASVIYGPLNNIHTSGHGGQEEQKLMLSLIKPKFFVPVHGNYRMLKIHGQLAESVGVEKDNIKIVSNGDVVSFSNGEITDGGKVPAEDVYIDTSGNHNIQNAVIRDRQKLGKNGVVIVSLTINLKKKEILSGPDVLSRGFVYMKESTKMISESRKIAFDTVRKGMFIPNVNEYELKNLIISELSQFFLKETGRRPILTPMIINIDENRK